MLWLVTGVVVLAAPMRVVCPQFSASGIADDAAAALLGRFAGQLARPGRIEVLTHRDLQELLGFERQKALLGCSSESSSCMAELGSALGADVMVSGTITQVGTRYIASLRALKMADGTAIYAESTRTENLDGVSDWIDAQAQAMASALAPPTRQASVSWAPWAFVGVGAAGAIAGTLLLGLAAADANTLRNPGPMTQLESVAQAGAAKQLSGALALGAGVLTVVGALVWHLVLSPAPQASAWNWFLGGAGVAARSSP